MLLIIITGKLLFIIIANSLKPSNKDVKTHKVLNSLHEDKDIAVLKPRNLNGDSILDKVDCIKGINEINDKHIPKEVTNDLSTNREGRLHHFLWDLKKKDKLDNDVYKSVYSSGSQPALIWSA